MFTQLKNSPSKISNLQVPSSHRKDLTSRSFPLFKDPMLPLFEGDDLRRLAQEITKARSFLWLARAFRYALTWPPGPALLLPGHQGTTVHHLLSSRSQLQKKQDAEPKATAL